jgi:hypothetical protein
MQVKSNRFVQQNQPSRMDQNMSEDPTSDPFDDDYVERDEPNDFAGVEFLWLLRTSASRHRAGKSYRPDPSGLRHAIKAADYKSGEIFLAQLYSVENLEDFFEYLQEWATDQSVFLVRGHYENFWGTTQKRHKITGHTGYVIYRRSVKTRGAEGYFAEYPRKLQMLDLDGIPLPEGHSVTGDPEGCVKWAVDHLLPPEFQQTSFIYQLSSSAGLTKLDNELNVHLWFITDQGFDNDEMRAWARWWNAKQQRKIIDPALYTAVQPHYINEPELLDGLVDPLAGRRLGLVQREHRTVHLYMPSTEEIAAELGSRHKRAIRQFKRARKLPAAPAGGAIDLDDDESLGAGPEDLIEDEASRHELYFDAVRIGPGWRGYLNAIGFEGHIRAQILAAVGSYFWEHGSRADREVLRKAIEAAIEASPFLDCAEPWSRPRSDARGYMTAPPGGKSNVDEMIADIGMRQADKERLANEPCDAEWTLPTLNADEAREQIDAAVQQIVFDAGRRRSQVLHDDDLDIHFQTPARAAVNCSPGTGKTEAMIHAVTVLVALDDEARVAIAVPTHKLGAGIADRINRKFGSEIAAEWYGTEHPDPAMPRVTMCRIAASAKEVTAVGGKLQALCSRRDNGQMTYCPHHPKIAGAAGCGYQRQQAPAMTNKIRVWVIPATMLANAPPLALRRTPRGPCGDFDLLIIDEAPWFSLLRRDPLKLPVESFSPHWWETEQSRISNYQKTMMLDVFGKICDVLSRQSAGEVSVDAFAAAGVRQHDIVEARRSVWRYKTDLRPLIEVGMKLSRLKGALSAVAARNQRVIEVAEALQCIWLQLGDQLAPSGMVLRDEDGERQLRLRRRREIDPAWLRAPTLYLDAAGLDSFQIARAWFPELDLKVDARAKAPNMTVAQLADSEMPYSRLVPKESDDQAARNNQARVAKIVRNLGRNGLVIAPKRLCQAWHSAKALPPGWMVWNFGMIRGRDDAKAVPRLVVVSRPMPPVSEIEFMAETIFRQRVARLPPGSRCPKKPVGRLMADGQGQRALAPRHPDPLAEAVRFAICEGELLQAVGRGRGVRRTAEAPLDVWLLTNVPIPVPIDRLITWKELNDDTGPLHELVAKGVVPLDYAGMAMVLGGRFNNKAKIKDWFHYRPEALATLQALRRRAEDPDGADMCELSENPYNRFLIEVFAQLAAYRYRRAGAGRQSNLVIVNGAMHSDARAAVERVLGPLGKFGTASELPPRRRTVKPMTPEEALARLTQA